ncbi:MAG: hypothetical protein QXS96_06940, partial [Candidatus Caldarchaeum sp.]
METREPITLPWDYRTHMTKAIYAILKAGDRDYSAWLHDHGFRWQNRVYRLFVYSDLMPAHWNLSSQGLSDVRWMSRQIGSPDVRIARNVPSPFAPLTPNSSKPPSTISSQKRHEFAHRLTLPTGLKKTLMGLYLPGTLQDGQPRPVLYALPYLSIIEQATDVACQVFPKDETDFSVIQHHSLSFPDQPDEGLSNFERARFALEDWDADLVVTTFDQLFYSFLSQDRGFIRRF